MEREPWEQLLIFIRKLNSLLLKRLGYEQTEPEEKKEEESSEASSPKVILIEAKSLPGLPPPDQDLSTGITPLVLDDETDEEVARTLRLIEETRNILTREKNKTKSHKKDKAREDEQNSGERKAVLPPLEERVQSIGDMFEELGKKPRSAMICFIMYDITNNRIRTKVAEYLEEKGCVRVQKSIFLGQIERRVYREIQETLHTIQTSYENNDSIFFVPVSEDEIRAMRVIGENIDMQFVLGRQNTLFF